MVYLQIDRKKETTNPDNMEIKDKIVLNGMTWAAADEMEYNTIGAFQTSESHTPGYYIVRWIGNECNLHEKYTCHVFYPPVIIPDCEQLFSQVYDTHEKNSFWYHNLDESIPIMVKLKQVVITYIELIQDNNTTNNLPSCFKGYADINPHLLSEHDHQIILDKIEARENINHDEYVEYENYYNVDSDDSDDDDN